jgi:hypothetical protein
VACAKAALTSISRASAVGSEIDFSPRPEHHTNCAERRQRNELSGVEEHSKREKEHKQMCTNGHMGVSIASISSKGRESCPALCLRKRVLRLRKKSKQKLSAEETSWSSGGLSGRGQWRAPDAAMNGLSVESNRSSDEGDR